MNRDEAKNVLLLYRTDADLADPQIVAAISFMKSDPELREWFEGYSAQQKILREKFRQIIVPAGLKEQIISEHKAMVVRNSRRDKFVAAGSLVVIVAALLIMAKFYLPQRSQYTYPPVTDNTFSGYETQMLYIASYNYPMNLSTNDLGQIQAYFAKNQCPADYTMPAALEKTAATGCAVQNFLGTKISMICFSTGQPLQPGHPGDLWLFVAPDSAVKDPPASATPQLAEVNGISVATWEQGGKIYLLATPGDQQAVQKYL
jgi:hypothetical protein